MDQFYLKGTDVDDCTLPEFKHLLIVFGGVGGIEAALEVIIYLCTLRLIKLRNMKTTISCVFDVLPVVWKINLSSTVCSARLL